jgi:hypothetical protein
MKVSEMCGEDLLALKRKYVYEENAKKGRDTGWLELEAAESLVTDEEVRLRYEGVDLEEADLDEYR